MNIKTTGKPHRGCPDLEKFPEDFVKQNQMFSSPGTDSEVVVLIFNVVSLFTSMPQDGVSSPVHISLLQ